MQQNKSVTIIGAGLVGSLLAVYLRKQGYAVTIFERRADMRLQNLSAGRSINLALSDRGLLALQEVGLDSKIKQIAIPMHGRFMHLIDGSNAYQPYGKEGQFINSVSRGTLNKDLMTAAEEHGATIHFNYKCHQIDWNNKTIFFETEQGIVEHEFDLLFAADGAFSAARLQHQLHHQQFNYHQYYINCGYKELTIPPNAANNFAMEVNALHIWPRKDYMLIALPNLDKTFTCTLFFPLEGEFSFDNLKTKEDVITFFETNFKDFTTLAPNYVNEFFENPTSTLVTVKCYPWVREDYFALIGDAAHAIVPFFGQGMNCGFEDCYVLNKLIQKHQHNWQNILQEYQQLRKPDGDAIADLAVNNFTEMRDKTADPMFLLQKKIEAKIHEKYPQEWIPAYSQVTFSPHIRYSEALQRGMRQEAIMQQIMQLPNIQTIWDSAEVENLILEKAKAL